MYIQKHPGDACAGGASAEERMLANIRRSALFQILGGSLGFLMPTIMLLWRGAGLSFLEITTLQAAFSLILTAFDAPTGSLADRLGRKPALMMATALLTAGAAVYGLADSFAGFLAAEALLGVGFAFASGADQALLYDSLLALGRKDDFGATWGRQKAAALVSGAVCCALGGLAGAVNLRFPCYLTLAGTATALILSCSFNEPVASACSRKRSVHGQIVETFSACLLRTDRLRWLFAYPALLGAFLQLGLWTYQPLFELGGIAVEYYGLLFAAFNLAAAASSRYAIRIEKSLTGYAALIAPLIVLSASYCLLACFSAKYAVAFVLAQQLVRGYVLVVFSEKLNRAADSELRATALSLQSTGVRLVYAALLLPMGLLMDSAGIAGALLALGLICLPAGLLTLGLFRARS